MKTSKFYYRLMGIGLLLAVSDGILKYYIDLSGIWWLDLIKGFGVGIVFASFYKMLRLRKEQNINCISKVND